MSNRKEADPKGMRNERPQSPTRVTQFSLSANLSTRFERWTWPRIKASPKSFVPRPES